jgi:hypothetical protein
MHAHRLPWLLALVGGFAVLAITQAPEASAKRDHAYHAYRAAHHTCGEFMFHRNGRCVDARNPSGGSWSQSMTSKSVW